MKKRRKRFYPLSAYGHTGSIVQSLIHKGIQKVKSIGSLIKKHIHRTPMTITEDMIYNSPFIIAEGYKGLTMEDIEFLEKEVEKYKKSLEEIEDK